MDFKQLQEKNRERLKINSLNNKINNLKAQLASEDYKIIKCVESYFIDKDAPLPYDIETMAAERNAIRAEINELEAQLIELKTQ